MNDGASAVIVCTRQSAEDHGLTPMAKIRSAASAGVDPTTMGFGPVPATQLALKRGWNDCRRFGVGRTQRSVFAAQSLGVIRKLGLQEDIVNVHGGAIALGHPLGCSGTRVLTTLLHAMERYQKNVGLATLCVGVGQGLSMIVEREH